ncbi:MAG: hypothetical protein AB1347_04375, partial [Acidobacteriota bacterium]
VPTPEPAREETAAPIAAPSSPPALTATPPLPAAGAPPLPPASDKGGSARELLAAGRFPEAARAYAAALRNETSPFTIDVEVACQPETLVKGLTAAGGDSRFMVLPYNLKGRDCYRVIWGLYPDRSSAETALASLPDFFKQHASPRVASWKRPGAP